MIYLKIGLGLVCLALGANLVFLIHKWMPQIDLKILIGVVILFLLPCITFNTLFPAFYFHFFCLLLIVQLVYFLFHKPVNLLLFLIPLLLTSSILGYGIYNLHHIKPTSYTLFTDKDIEPTKIVYIADLHYPTGMTPLSLTKLVDRLQKEEPDFYALGGDIVDEFTTKKEMESVFSKLGKLSQVAPVYYVYGNHDNQHYSSQPVFTKEEIKKELEQNQIQVLQDTVVQTDAITLIGREDAEEKDRKSLEELAGPTEDTYKIVLDHQPIELDNCIQNDIDLQISGHTHRGQIFPLGFLSNLFRVNEHDYGIKQQEGFTQITSSGVNGWGFPLRTEGKSEYVVIHITND
ncbi:metallophosphoesterase [Faecalicoccus acidiformans]|uniref:metallophosphoesterase n=1 Tax=Faecalicoccus acidiformans TaxID=915173 RepID=UPI0025A34A94|nr:metallophosphoesterase [Faecalicoccus acidiformans]MDM8203339.1 metallophosphoesterase [Faecalicoccus acidiformans]